MGKTVTLEEEEAPPDETPLITTADALEALGEGEAQLTTPAGTTKYGSAQYGCLGAVRCVSNV